jgi:adenine-specific DNA-methyltransferase
MAHLRYMGTKRDLAPVVASIISGLPSGPCLDLFAGMCSVAGQVALSGRTVWCNDVQKYAAVVAECLIGTVENPPTRDNAMHALELHFLQNMRLLQRRWDADLMSEARTLRRHDQKSFARLHERWRHVGNDATLRSEALRLRRQCSKPHRLTTLNFAHGYFGLKQANQLDSIRYAIDTALKIGSLTVSEARWCLVALLQTANRLVTSTGHFAQYLIPANPKSFSNIAAIRRRCAWATFMRELQTLVPYGTESWRSKNKVFREEACKLSHRLQEVSERPKVVYADPPYSEAQYSRYYHVMESLIAYDYPEAGGKGRYRADRFNTDFCKPPHVCRAFCELFEGVARTGANLVLSYPSNGLLIQRGYNIFALLSRYFRQVTMAYRASQEHSTLGSWPGAATKATSEMVIVASRPRI